MRQSFDLPRSEGQVDYLSSERGRDSRQLTDWVKPSFVATLLQNGLFSGSMHRSTARTRSVTSDMADFPSRHVRGLTQIIHGQIEA